MDALVARFDSPEALVAAVERFHAKGYRTIDAFAPFPLPRVTELIGGKTSSIGWIAALFALIGGALTYVTIHWSAVLDYPLNVGGRPLLSWPAFLPVVLVAAALWSGLAALIGMLWLCGLPRWHHPLFDVKQFDRATYDKYFLLVGLGDSGFDPAKTRSLLESLSPEHIDEVRA